MGTIWEARRRGAIVGFCGSLVYCLSSGGQTPPYAFVDNNGRALFLTMSRYEVALERSMHRTLAELERMQEARAPRTADGMLGELIRNLSGGA